MNDTTTRTMLAILAGATVLGITILLIADLWVDINVHPIGQSIAIAGCATFLAEQLARWARGGER